MQFLIAALSAIPSAATTGYAFAAYGLVIAAYIFTVWRVSRNKALLANIQKLPAKDRLAALQIEMGGVHLAKGISPEQWVRSRIHKYYLVAFLATCAAVAIVGAIALQKGGGVIRVYNVVNNEYQVLNNGVSLSESDVTYLRDLIEAAKSHDVAKTSAAFYRLSEPARAAYARAYPLVQNDLPAPENLKLVGLSPSEQSATQVDPARINLLSQKNGGEVLYSPAENWAKTNDDSLALQYGFGSSEGVFGFKDGRRATYDTFGVYLPGTDSRHPKDIELFAGDDGITGSFRSLGVITLLNGKLRDGWQNIRLPETTSRFFKVKLVSNFGGNDIYLYEFRLEGVLK